MLLKPFCWIVLAFLLHLNTRATLPGDRDTLFNAPPFNGAIETMAIDADGRILVGGSFTKVGTADHQALVRLNSDGTLDEHFEPGFSASERDVAVKAIVVRPNRKILVGGTFETIHGRPRPALVQLHEDGTVDNQFNLDSSLVAKSVSALTPLQDGKTWVGGTFSPSNSQPDVHIMRLNENGIVDVLPDLNLLGLYHPFDVLKPVVHSILVQRNESIMIGGEFRIHLRDISGPFQQYDYSLIRMSLDGKRDSTFRTYLTDANSFHPRPVIRSLAVTEDSQVLVGGYFGGMLNELRFGLARINPDDTLDNTFNPLAAYRDLGARLFNFRSVLPLSGDKTLIGGSFTLLGSTLITNIALLNGNGSVDPTFIPKTTLNNDVSDLLLQNDEKLLIAGSALTNNILRYGVERLHLVIHPSSSSPEFSVQPQDQRILPGGTASFNVLASGLDVKYQWTFNGDLLVGETNNTLLVQNASMEKAGDYSVVASNKFGKVTSAVAKLILLDLTEALDSPDLGWRTGGFSHYTNYSPDWVSQTLISYDGLDAARSATMPVDPLSNKESSWIETSVTGPGIFRCQIKFDLPHNITWSRATWLIDETNSFLIRPIIYFAPGSTNWMLQEIFIPSGIHTIKLLISEPRTVVYLDQAQFMKGETPGSPTLRMRHLSDFIHLGSSTTIPIGFRVEATESLESPTWSEVTAISGSFSFGPGWLVPLDYGKRKRFYRIKLP